MPRSGGARALFQGLADAFNRYAQKLGDAPGLRAAAACTMRRGSIGDLSNLPESGRIHEIPDSAEPLRCLPLGRHRSAVHFDVRRNEGSHQPRPDGSLVISGIAAPDVAFVAWAILRIARREASQPDRCD